MIKINQLRSRMGLTQKELAEHLGTTQQTIARWETGKTQLNVHQAKDLCVVLQCSIEELLGWEIGPEEWRDTPFAVADAGIPYGSLLIETAVDNRTYPIDENAHDSLHMQLQDLDSFRRQDRKKPWIHSWTLDNKILLLNPFFIRKIELISDDVEAMPPFQHPEVYRALDDWGVSEVTGKVLEASKRLIAELGEEEATRLATHFRITYSDGKDEWSYLTEEEAANLFRLELDYSDIPASTFVEVAQEGYHRSRYINLDHVVAIEVPADRYHRRGAAE